MSDNKALIQDYLRALSGRAKPTDIVDKYVADPALAKHIAETEAAFPNYELATEDLIAEGNKVAMRGQFRGTHQGTFAGIEPTGKKVSAGLMITYRIENGRIAEHWMQFDRLALLHQLQA